MSRLWTEIVAEWDRDPAFQAAYAAEYPYAEDSIRVLRARAELEMTEQQFADHLGIKLRTLRQYESGHHPVPRRFRA